MNQIASAMGSAMNNQQSQQPTTTNNTSQMGAALAMQAMQKKLRPQHGEEDDFTESGIETESLPQEFQQANALRHPPPPMARPIPQQSIEEVLEDSEASDLSSDLSMSEDGGDNIRKVSQNPKRPAPKQGSNKSKKQKNSVNISL